MCLKKPSAANRSRIVVRHVSDESSIDLAGASEMDEIEIDLDEDAIPEVEYKTIKSELGDDVDFVSLDELEQDSEEEEEDQ